VVFSGTYISLHKRPGQRLTIAKDGERNGPLPTTRSGDDDDLYTATYTGTTTAAVYNSKWRTDQHWQYAAWHN